MRIDVTNTDSSVIAGIRYDDNARELTVYLVGGRQYTYVAVDGDTVADFLSSESLGSFYNSRIKAHFALKTPKPIIPRHEAEVYADVVALTKKAARRLMDETSWHLTDPGYSRGTVSAIGRVYDSLKENVVALEAILASVEVGE